MARYEFRMQRLFVSAPLASAAHIMLGREPSHYLAHVLRLAAGASVLVFNGRDGEWQARIAEVGKKGVSLHLESQTRAQTQAGRLTYAFAPLKHARLDYMVQKAVEMGADMLWPVATQHTQATRLNLDRMRANAIEAAEQCGILAIPAVRDETRFAAFLAARAADDTLIFADEDAIPGDGMRALAGLRGRPLTLLVGPEGGFSSDERATLLAQPRTVRLSLGPRILRADTAAVAALALVQSAAGDWQG
ncbi:MAG: 16S rRNA (uracil(1498)-N(3))-methyltransferase [Beijerinckiaceae bacterium]